MEETCEVGKMYVEYLEDLKDFGSKFKPLVDTNCPNCEKYKDKSCVIMVQLIKLGAVGFCDMLKNVDNFYGKK